MEKRLPGFANMKIRASPDTLLRVIRKGDLPPCPDPKIIGIDDWVIRKGRDYAALIVELDRHQSIGVLPDRTQETVQAWLEQHPGI